MPSKYKVLNLFENPQAMIIEIKLLGLPHDISSMESHHWLYLDKTTMSMIKLWFRSQDSSTDIEELYFEQGYLKFTTTEATYIEKFNSSLHKLINYTKRPINDQTHAIIEQYLEQPGGKS